MARKGSAIRTLTQIAHAMERQAKAQAAAERREAIEKERERRAAERQFEAAKRQFIATQKQMAKEQAILDAQEAKYRTAQKCLKDQYAMTFQRIKELKRLQSNATTTEEKIAYLREEAELFPELMDFEMRKSILENVSFVAPHTDAFSELSKVYEAKGDYDRAIQTCHDACELNVDTDSMTERIETLRREKEDAAHAKMHPVS